MQETYSIPRQTIDLTTGNIAYIAPEFELSPESGMPKNYVASADVSLSDIVNFREEGNKHILTLKTDTVVFEYPSSEQKKAGKKAFVGIFLVLGINGQIHVEVRTITTGDARAGFAYKAYGYGLLPYFVGPYATYRPASFDMSFTVNGEVNTTSACVPQVGVIIWGTELGVLQIWVDFKASGSIDLKAFGELVGYLLGTRYSIFYIDYPLYSGEWTVGEAASGSGGDAVREVAPHILVLADAYNDSMKHNLQRYTDAEGKILIKNPQAVDIRDH